MTRLPESGLKAPDFVARPPWWGGDLQTLRNLLVQPRHDLSAWPSARLELPLGDGDRLLGSLHGRLGEGGNGKGGNGEGSRPLVLLLHGLSGCEDSLYMRASAHHLLSLGWRVLRLNLRGAGPSAALCRGHYHAGRSEDLREALAVLARDHPYLTGSGVVCVGYSLGGNMLLKCLGEGGFPVPILAAVAVSAPLDLKAAQIRLMQPRNALYHRYVLANMCRDFRVGAAGDPLRRKALLAIGDVREFDERITAPLNGFASAEEYYERSSAKGFLAAIRTPTLVIFAADDPWIPAESYRGLAWGRFPGVTLLMPSGGGHVGFHSADSPVPWHDRRIAEFFANIR